MRHVRATASLDCAASVAEALIPKFFELQKDRSGAIRMPIEISLDEFGLPTSLELAKHVELRVDRGRDDENLNEVFRITWVPSGGGPFPHFNGTMIVWSEDDPNTGFIALDGAYEPPKTIAGGAFDATIGHRIAERSVQHFLERVAEGVRALRATV